MSNLQRAALIESAGRLVVGYAKVLAARTEPDSYPELDREILQLGELIAALILAITHDG